MRKMILALLATALIVSPAFAEKQRPIGTALGTNVVQFTGQGLLADGFGGYDLVTELCGAANGADADGPYLLWVLTATKATSATILLPGASEPVAMTKFGNGTFKYVSGWYDPDTLPGNVTATYNGAAKNAQLVISHGCRPYTNGAWCSPGFWHNATAAAWALVGYAPTDLFNGNVSTAWYGADLATNPDLLTVVNNASTYSGKPLAGTLGFNLNAFNATGAFLTDHIPGFQFDWDVMQGGSSTACPIDHFGNFK